MLYSRRVAAWLLAAAAALSRAAAALPSAASAAADEIDWACDPLVPESCMLPFPNDFWRVVEDGRPHLNISLSTFPVDKDGKPIDAQKGGWNDLAGFSPFQAMHAYFPGTDDVSIEGCARWWNIDFSLSEESPTVLLDAVTGERVAHWVEIDYTSVPTPEEAQGMHAGIEVEVELEDDRTNRHKHVLMIWPATKLEHDRRYIVAIKHLPSRYGGNLPTSPAFRALRDRLPSKDPRVTSRRAHFEEIFASLEKLGVKRDELLLTWDFTTNTRENVVSRMLSARDDARARLGEDGPHYIIREVVENPNEYIRRKIAGDYRVPMYLNTHLPKKDARLVVDDEGHVVFQSWAWFKFEALIPNSLANGKKAGRILQYGHGLFGTLTQVEGGWLAEQADKYGYVLCANTWIGLSNQDIPAAVNVIVNDLTDFMYIPDRTTQGIINALSLMQMMRGRFARDDLVTFDGVSTIDPSKTAYYGNSEGGIFGTIYMAMTQDVEYGLLGVPGGPYSLLLPRSYDFRYEYALLKRRYKDPIDRINLMQVMQLLWDRAEPSGYMDAVSKNPLPNTPEHKVLLHYGLGDAQVTWLGAQAIARQVNAVMYESNVPEHDEKFFGFEMLKDTDVVYERSGIVGWQYDAPPVPEVNHPPTEEFDTHGLPRKDTRAQVQMNQFFEQHVITNTCEGPCTKQE